MGELQIILTMDKKTGEMKVETSEPVPHFSLIGLLEMSKDMVMYKATEEETKPAQEEVN